MQTKEWSRKPEESIVFDWLSGTLKTTPRYHRRLMLLPTITVFAVQVEGIVDDRPLLLTHPGAMFSLHSSLEFFDRTDMLSYGTRHCQGGRFVADAQQRRQLLPDTTTIVGVVRKQKPKCHKGIRSDMKRAPRDTRVIVLASRLRCLVLAQS